MEAPGALVNAALDYAVTHVTNLEFDFEDFLCF